MKSSALRERDAAIYVGMSISYLRQTRMEGNRKGRTPGPAYIKIGRAVRYLIEDLDAWLKENRVTESRMAIFDKTNEG